MKQRRMTHHFVEEVPDAIREGILYVSIPFATAIHRCCCGCGSEVVTPLTPTDWSVLFNGETVSLQPSIGSWSLPCQSHYWLRQGRVEWAGPWTTAEIHTGRSQDRVTKQKYLDEAQSVDLKRDSQETSKPAKPESWLTRVLRRLRFGKSGGGRTLG